MEPDGISRDPVLKILVELMNDTCPNIYFVPKERKDLIEQNYVYDCEYGNFT